MSIRRVVANLKKFAEENDEFEGTPVEEILADAKKEFANSTYDVDDVSFATFLTMVKSGGDMFLDVPDDWYESMSDTQYADAEQWLKHNYRDEYDADPELLTSVYEAISEEYTMKVNYDFSTVLLRTEHSIAGDDFSVTTHGMDDDELLAEFDKEEAAAAIREAGFGDKQILEILHANAEAPGLIYLGVLSDDAVDGLSLNANPTGQAILATHDFYNGAGDFVIVNKTITTTIHSNKDFLDSIDSGKYSLGAVFGTSEWTYS